MFKFFQIRGCLSRVRDNRTIRRHTPLRRGACAGGGVMIGCCTGARLQFERISLRSGQRIIASFRQKRQIGAARAARARA
ncbi:hypothetical protein [Burkholderia metallica]|uniref:hypothetical protein n=1 Tax=Burkholderia metallica TaxID=488729 RepID=UPI00131E07E3|nr:hypothetical protein [Burkholderia metallica]